MVLRTLFAVAGSKNELELRNIRGCAATAHRILIAKLPVSGPESSPTRPICESESLLSRTGPTVTQHSLPAVIGRLIFGVDGHFVPRPLI